MSWCTKRISTDPVWKRCSDKGHHVSLRKPKHGFRLSCGPSPLGRDGHRDIQRSGQLQTGQMLGDKPWPIGREKTEAIAVDIEIGSRAWPPEQPDETRPIGVVHFLFYGRNSGRRSEFALSEPPPGREFPPSTCWSKNIIHHCLGRNRDGTDKLRPCESRRRDDGVQVFRIATLRGPADDGPDMYRYIEQGFAFDFTAERRFSLLVVTDMWEVRLDPPGRDGLSAGKLAGLGAGRRREIVGNIEEASSPGRLRQGEQRCGNFESIACSFSTHRETATSSVIEYHEMSVSSGPRANM